MPKENQNPNAHNAETLESLEMSAEEALEEIKRLRSDLTDKDRQFQEQSTRSASLESRLQELEAQLSRSEEETPHEQNSNLEKELEDIFEMNIDDPQGAARKLSELLERSKREGFYQSGALIEQGLAMDKIKNEFPDLAFLEKNIREDAIQELRPGVDMYTALKKTAEKYQAQIDSIKKGKSKGDDEIPNGARGNISDPTEKNTPPPKEEEDSPEDDVAQRYEDFRSKIL
jgi:chromosome segregation ATPase